jgi:hypothetical protein
MSEQFWHFAILAKIVISFYKEVTKTILLALELLTKSAKAKI